MDGGAGWTVQYPDGRHHHVYPDGKSRYHKWDLEPCTSNESRTRFPIDYDFSKSHFYYDTDLGYGLGSGGIGGGIIGEGIAIAGSLAWSVIW